MKENKLTPEEIIKALECCAIDGAEGCMCCPLFQKPNCPQILSNESLSIINRQQAAIDVYMQENDRLKTAYIQVSTDRYEIKAENDELKREREAMLEDLQFRTNQVIEQQAEIERLQTENNQFADIGKMYSEIRAEAIKEFAQRLNEKLAYYEDEYGLDYGFMIDTVAGDVFNLVKEMVGEE